MAQIFSSERSRPKSQQITGGMREAPDAHLAELQAQADQSERTKNLAQLQADEAEIGVEEDDPIQEKSDPAQRVSTQGAAQSSALNSGGLPAAMQSGMEQVSGADLSDVKVHYNSPKPAALQAHAYAQGTDIHLAPGQEKHLGHEAWHTVQQKQGRVQPTMDVAGTPVNDSPSLESEADQMGAKFS